MSQHVPERWTCWHLHTDSWPQLTPVVLDTVVPVINTITTEYGGRWWHFLRYWQLGPHVRLRVRDVPESAIDMITKDLGDRLMALATTPPDQRLDDERYQTLAASAAAVGDGRGSIDAGILRFPGVYREHYEPEYFKYGGTSLIELSESLFHHSSRLSVALLRTYAEPQGGVGNVVGLNVLLTGLAALGEDLRRLQRFAERARDHWALIAEAVLLASGVEELSASARATGDSLARQPDRLLSLIRSPSGALGSWTAALREAMRPWQSDPDPDRFLISHLHMFCNRLGIYILSEAYLWAVLCEFLARVGQGVTK